MSAKLYGGDTVGDFELEVAEEQPEVIGDVEPAEPKPGLPPQPPKDVEGKD